MIILLLKVTGLFALALVSLSLLRRSSAAMRHVVCLCALIGALFLPLTLLAPPEVNAFRIGPSTVFSASRTVTHATAPWATSTVLMAVWILGSGFLLIRIVIGYLMISRLLRVATPFEAIRTVRVFFADVSVPLVSGLLRPVILLPRSAELWPTLQRAAAMRHEFEHVERKDLWAALIGHLACAVYWFHPLVWVVAGRSCHERESACDDAVLSAGFEPTAYAEAIVAAARNITSTRLTGCHMLSPKTLKVRIARLLDSEVARNPSHAGIRGAVLTSAAVIALVGLLIGTQRARAGDDNVYKIGDGVTRPKVLTKVEPEYMSEAQTARIQGTVELSVVIGTDGLAHDFTVVRGLDSGLDKKAAEAVAQWHFRPGSKNGEPVKVRVTVEVNFRLT